MFEIFNKPRGHGRHGCHRQDKVNQALDEYLQYATEVTPVPKEEPSFFAKLWDLVKGTIKRVLAFVGGGLIGLTTIVTLPFIGPSWFHLGTGLLGLGLMLWGVAPLFSSSKKTPALENKERLKLPEPIDVWTDDVNEFDRELFNKALSDHKKITENIGKLENMEMKAQLAKMQGISAKMITYMKNHPDRISLAERFVNYYQDRAVTLSNEFVEFEQIGLETEEITQVKQKVIDTISSFDEAYADQFLSLMRNKIMDVESEVKVAEKIMEEFGVKNKS